MKQPKILVTGATGRTGSAVVDELLAKDVPVRALVYSKDARSEALERKGAETVVADMFDLDQLLVAVKVAGRALPWSASAGARAGGSRSQGRNSSECRRNNLLDY
jgi:uncharacterized protein YbjT (DUF2867 family)